MLHSDPLPYACSRVTLRRLTIADIAAFQHYRNDPMVGQYQGWIATSDEKAREFLAEVSVITLFESDQWFQIGIADSASNLLIGDIGICVREGAREAEIGFSMRAESQGQGLATDAVRGAISMIFNCTTVHRVIGVTDERNLPSIRLLERLGMQKTATQNAVFRGEACVEFTYATLRNQAVSVEA
jgi:[ribosomal protein S5]-alanine N-acetyltransferase